MSERRAVTGDQRVVRAELWRKWGGSGRVREHSLLVELKGPGARGHWARGKRWPTGSKVPRAGSCMDLDELGLSSNVGSHWRLRRV